MSTRFCFNVVVTRTLFLLLFIISAISESPAIGIVVTRIPDLPPPKIKSVKIDSVITNSIEKTRFSQVLYNDSSLPSEADFFFPVPDGASISDFVLYMDGKPVRGEVLKSDEARDIYRDIVRQIKDPGLIEWSEKNLYRVRIFPVPAHGEQKLEIEITRQLPSDQGYFHLRIPMKSKGSDQAPTVNCSIQINDEHPIRNLYSPTHTIKQDTTDPRHVKVTLENPTASSDLSLFYQTSDEAVVASLLTHKASGADGFFSLRLSPPWQKDFAPNPNANYVFVVDTSGSMMDDDKITQARKSLKYCINSLEPGNRFNIIPFATAVDTMETSFVDSTPEQKSRAIKWIDNLNARGGTNISGALQSAAQLISKDKSTSSTDRLYTIVFITDGLPTVGISDPDQILKSLDGVSSTSSRIFTFGLGNDVNTKLLDQLAEKSRAASDYIAPGKDLELPISRFFDKVSRPALYNTRLQFDGTQALEIYPQQLPDLFYGSDMMILGKYRNPGQTKITLTGTINGETKAFEFNKAFAGETSENSYLEKLWATRKVAWMLDQIRTNGDSTELKKEVEDLGKKYGIVTPYTSYLAMEDKPSVTPTSRAVSSPNYSLEARDLSRSDSSLFRAAPMGAAKASNQSMDLKSESGARAVQTAQHLSLMKKAETYTQSETESQTTTAGKKQFTLKDGYWIDTAIQSSTQPPAAATIRYLSNAWFDLSDADSEIKSYLSVGKNIRFQLSNGKIIEISENSGSETIDVTALTNLLK